ncbi:MAG: hypothetical protein JNM52_11060 [Betaproteobacteria bacterium]|nr:hypothetical protein [Betaproteobacteria bacterium]
MQEGVTNGELILRDKAWEAALAACNARLRDVQKQLGAPTITNPGPTAPTTR